MIDVEKQLESENYLISIEEEANFINDRLNIIDQGIKIINGMESRSTISKESLQENSLTEGYFTLALENFKNDIRALGYSIDLETENLSLEDKFNKLILSEENLAADIWVAIKKIMETIWSAITKMYAAIKKFFGIEKSKIEEDNKKIDSLKDLNDFEIDSKLTEVLVKKYKSRLPIFMSLGLDLTSRSDLDIYSNLIKANNWPLVNYELFIKGSNTDKESELQYDQGFKVLGNKSDKVFNNVNGLLTKEYKSKVNGHYIVGVGVNEAYIVSLFKTGDSLIKLSNNTLTVDQKNLDSSSKTKLSRLNKKVLNKIVDIRSDLIDKESSFEKDGNVLKKKMEEFYASSIKNDKGSKEMYSGNIKVIGNILSKSIGSLVKHVTTLDTLTDDLIKVYEKASSKSN